MDSNSRRNNIGGKNVRVNSKNNIFNRDVWIIYANRRTYMGYYKVRRKHERLG